MSQWYNFIQFFLSFYCSVIHVIPAGFKIIQVFLKSFTVGAWFGLFQNFTAMSEKLVEDNLSERDIQVQTLDTKDNKDIFNFNIESNISTQRRMSYQDF